MALETAASSIRPALSSCSGFLNTLPNVRRLVGCASFRRAVQLAHLGFDLVRGPRPQPQLGAQDDLPVPSSECR
jgi:hypothetical protein